MELDELEVLAVLLLVDGVLLLEAAVLVLELEDELESELLLEPSFLVEL